MNNKSLYNGFFGRAAIELHQVNGPKFGPKVSAAIELKELESFKSNPAPRTANKRAPIFYRN